MNSARPLVSVVLPLYNGETYVAQAIESVLVQDVRPIEVVVVDDASTDGSPAIVRSYHDRVRYVRVDKQRTMVATTNIGLREATGRYVCVLHQDDFLLPGKLARQVDVMERDPEIGFSYSAQWFVGPCGQPLGRLRSPLGDRSYIVDGGEELRHLAVQNYLNFCNVLMRRSHMLEAGLFEEPNWVIADWQMWLRLALRHRVAYLEQPLVCYRIHPEAQTLTRTQRSVEWQAQVRGAIEGFYADPLVPEAIRARRPLSEASLALNVALMRLYRGDWGGAARALTQAGRTAGARRLPELLHSAAVVPRVLPRVRMVRQQRRRTGWPVDRRTAALTCPHCAAIAGYPQGALGGAMRCIVCGAGWGASAPARSNRPGRKEWGSKSLFQTATDPREADRWRNSRA